MFSDQIQFIELVARRLKIQNQSLVQLIVDVLSYTVKPARVVLGGAQSSGRSKVAVDTDVTTREVSGRGRVQVAVGRHHVRTVLSHVERTLSHSR